jgi:DNA-directed RNA polymerase specialized sigma24 family protein
MILESYGPSAAPPSELAELSGRVRGEVQLAIAALVPCLDLAELDPEDHPSAEDDLVTQLAVRQFVETLKPADKTLVNAIYWQDQAAADVARAMGITPSAISQRLSRVYRLGREYFAEPLLAA